MHGALTRENRPITAALFLGERSPWGLSVARALMDSGLDLRRVLVPSDRAWQRVAARAARGADAPRPPILGRVVGAVSRRAGLNEIPADLAARGVPIAPIELDPGVTVEDLEMACARRGVPWVRVDDLAARSLATLPDPDGPALLLSAAFPLIFGSGLLATPALGCVNFHPSLLPRCRGCHPIYWTIACGETQGGVTAHFMTREIDAGDIIAQIPLPLTAQDDYGSLYRRAMAASIALVAQVEAFFRAGRRAGTPQDRARATVFCEDTEEDHRVRWAGRSPAEIAALSRTGEAFTMLRGERLGILEATEVHAAHRERRLSRAGTVIAVNDGLLLVAASGGAVGIRSLSWRGRKYRADDLARGLGIARGKVLA